MGNIKHSIRRAYIKLRENKLYLWLKNSSLRRLWLIAQEIHHRFNVHFGKVIILHDDRIFKEIFKFIGQKIRITSIMETGTYLGFTTEYLSKKFPRTPIFTCEIMEPIYLKARNRLKKYPNIKVLNSDSIKLLSKINKNKFGERPMFYLDAHGGGGECPLEKEISFIGKNFSSAIMIIDDFKIGNKIFQYDKYDGKEISVEMIKPNMNKKIRYNLLFPNYDERAAYKNSYGNLTGYAIIFQGLEKEFNEILKHPFVSKFFLDKSNLLK